MRRGEARGEAGRISATKLPAGAHADEFIERMRREIAGRATDLARGLISEADYAAD